MGKLSTAEYRAEQLNAMVKALTAWFETTVTTAPNLESGKRSSIQFYGRCSAETEEGENLFTFNVKVESEHTIY